MSSNDAYDPLAPEDGPPGKSAYVTRKDVRVVGVALIVLAVMSYPVFRYLVRVSERARCTKNMHAIMVAMSAYADQNDDKFPPLFDPGPAGEPALQTSGAPYTWASVIQEYMDPKADFVCPSAEPSELTRSQDSASVAKSFPLSYGMFAPMSTMARSLVEDPDDAVLFAETSNLGATGTYDPQPYFDSKGQRLPYDGMAIGWDNNNFLGNKQTKSVTRLAFPGTSTGVFLKSGPGRHDEGSFEMTVTGHIRNAHPDTALVTRRYGDLYGQWPMPLAATQQP